MKPTVTDWRDPDYQPIFEHRTRVLLRVREDPQLLGAMLKYYASDMRHVVDFIEDWGTLHEPRRVPKAPTIPFCLFPKQREFLRWLVDRYEKRESAVVEKSRDAGVTWLCSAFSVYLWRFFPGTKIGFGSRVEDLVDRIGDPDSIFEKIRIFIRYLPREFWPLGYSEKHWAGHMRIRNNDNGSVITGQAGDEIGRGGRSTIFFLDEAASIERPDRVDAALSNNSDCIIHVSTPKGAGNPFYRKRHGGQYPVFTFHWREDPRKDDAWYAGMARKLDPVILAQEVDIDYHASVENVVIEARWVRAARDIGALMDFPEYRGGVAGLDVAAGGTGKSVFIARFGPFVDPPKAWGDGDTTETAERAIDLAWCAGVDRLYFDTIGVGKGVASTLKRLRRRRAVQADGTPFRSPLGGRVSLYIETVPVTAGAAASDAEWPDGLTSRAKFANIKAESWWLMRQRFQATYEMWLYLKGNEKGRKHRADDLIVLPKGADDEQSDIETLAQQLSQVTWKIIGEGKIAIESKDSLKSRGIASPDYADCLVLTFTPLNLAFEERDIEGMY